MVPVTLSRSVLDTIESHERLTFNKNNIPCCVKHFNNMSHHLGCAGSLTYAITVLIPGAAYMSLNQFISEVIIVLTVHCETAYFFLLSRSLQYNNHYDIV